MNSKIKSRKLWAWIVTCIFCIGTVIYTKTVTAEVVNMYGLITMVYIGGNTAVKYISKDKDSV